MTIQMIPAARCRLSPRNVRRTAAMPAAFEQLKADIAARGVLQNLIGFVTSKRRGTVEITAGGRRLAAVQQLIAEAVFGDDYAIPVFVLNDTGTAAEISLAENFQRLAMNPADECIAFRHFIEAEAKSVDEIARRFGLTPRFVEGRVRLAGLAHPVFEALQSGEISLEIAQAFGTTSDVDRQAAVFGQYRGSYYGLTAANVRRAMTTETITGAHALAKLVGRDAYVAAGGRVERDLFADQAEEIWLDADLVTTMGEARMTEAAAAVSGYANVVPVLAHRPDWDLTRTLRPVQGERIAPSEAEAARLAEIETELEAMEADSESGDGDANTAAFDERVETLQAEAEALGTRTAAIDDATRTTATAFLVIGSDGQPVLYETVYVDAASETDASGDGRPDDADNSEAAVPALGKPLRDELAEQRTALLRLHVANDPGFAIDLAIFLLADAKVSQGRCFDRGSTLAGSHATRAYGYKLEGPIADQLQSLSDGLDHSWAAARDTAARFDAFRALDDDKRGAWAGWTIARTLEPKLADERESGFHNHLGRSLGIDVAAWWRPTAANFFTRVKKGVTLAALERIGGPGLKERYANAKRGDLAAAAEKICTGNAIIEAEVKAVALGWVPEVMTFASPGETATDDNATAVDTNGTQDMRAEFGSGSDTGLSEAA